MDLARDQAGNQAGQLRRPHIRCSLEGHKKKKKSCIFAETFWYQQAGWPETLFCWKTHNYSWTGNTGLSRLHSLSTVILLACYRVFQHNSQNSGWTVCLHAAPASPISTQCTETLYLQYRPTYSTNTEPAQWVLPKNQRKTAILL